jgi:hypothetical protein
LRYINFSCTWRSGCWECVRKSTQIKYGSQCCNRPRWPAGTHHHTPRFLGPLRLRKNCSHLPTFCSSLFSRSGVVDLHSPIRFPLWHPLLQPSSLTLLPSSQTYAPSTFPLPHKTIQLIRLVGFYARSCHRRQIHSASTLTEITAAVSVHEVTVVAGFSFNLAQTTPLPQLIIITLAEHLEGKPDKVNTLPT